MTTVDVGLINIPRKVGVANWLECFDRTAERAEVFAICENLYRPQQETYLREARERGLRVHGIRSPNPVFWDPAKFTLVRGRVVQLHPAATGPLAREYPGFNSARYATEVILNPVDGDRDLAVWATHWVPRGPKVDPQWREEVRGISRRRTARNVRAHALAGRDVLTVGDFNIGEPFDLLSGHRWIVGDGVDKIGAAPARRVESSSSHRYRAPTDHEWGVVARVVFQ